MTHNIDAIYDHGVFRPIEPLSLPQGARVHLRIHEDNGSLSEAVENRTDYNAWIDSLAGRWQGEFLRGDEGSFETRELLS